ncbi:MAG: succinylglutamate desuccinylase/aspartoacylase family protein [Lachnospiraceae bacterium]|nr:succinylglutamate desuccinylase/aspartoacylase family protein [Lachnospiraceae bacterium]
MTLEVKTKNPVNYITAAVLLILCCVMFFVLKGQFETMSEPELVYYGKNSSVKAIHWLSEWNPRLKETRGGAGDTLVYELRGEEEGDTIIIFGGVHANEPSGSVAAIYMVENLHPKAGTVYILTHTNAAGYTCTDPQEASPMFYTVDTGAGERQFRFGSRVSNPIYQWPDPDIYVHTSGQKLAGSETRNLNRCYPGIEDGTITEQVAYALTEMVKDLDAAVTIDLHEASPEYKTINTTVFHSRANSITSARDWYIPEDLEDAAHMGAEVSPENFRGLSHIELGTWTDTLAMLMETSNPSQGREHGKTGTDLVVNGIDKFYLRNNQSVGIQDKRYGIEVDTGEFVDEDTFVAANDSSAEEMTALGARPLSMRVARHVIAALAYAQSYTDSIGTALEDAAAAATEEDRLAIYEEVGIGKSSLDGSIIAERRTGIIDLGELPSYSDLCANLYKYLAPSDEVETSADVFAGTSSLIK